MTPKQGSDDQPVDYICITPEHIASGRSVPDGLGTLTVNGRQWAYCTAGLKNASHDWKETGGVAFEAIHHADLPLVGRT
ncbi:MAG TPA: hypothetical protein VM070_01680 [Candidatus Saccharimonadales bacterium]|nr:hypothetical protein [Candidatus Saccharimonadales bacterium]